MSKLSRILCGALFLIILAIVYGRLCYNKGYLTAQKDYEIKIAQAKEQALKKERELQNEIDTIMQRMTDEINAKNTAIVDARNATDRLRKQINTYIHEPKNTETTTATHATITKGWDLFADCSAKYQQMGAVADEQVEQLRLWQSYAIAIDKQ